MRVHDLHLSQQADDPYDELIAAIVEAVPELRSRARIRDGHILEPLPKLTLEDVLRR